MFVNRFLYPRTITITRPQPRAGATTVGKQGYGGTSISNEAQVASGLPAAIQFVTTARGTGAQLPSDARAMVDFRVIIPKGAAALGLITERDIITDDLNKRYQVYSAYWNSLGYSLRATLLEV